MKIDALLDTSILIDIVRGYPPCTTWFQTTDDTVFALPVVTYMEFIHGARNKREKQLFSTALSDFLIVPLTEDDSIWAYQTHFDFVLSHNVGVLDALIAAPAARLSIPIYTLNAKHFNPLPDVKVIKPY